MDNLENILRSNGAKDSVSLIDILNINHTADVDTEEINTIEHSHYYGDDDLMKKLKSEIFSILSINIHSLNAKFDELNIYINRFLKANKSIKVICLQETWIQENSNISLFQIEN